MSRRNHLGAMKTRVKPAVVLFTDIGQDLDDTLALFLLLGAHDVLDLVAVVTSLSRTAERAALVQTHLMNMGREDITVIPGRVAADMNIRQDGSEFPVDGFPANYEQLDELVSGFQEKIPHANKLLAGVLKKNQHRQIYIIGIGALSGLADFIQSEHRYLLNKVCGVYLQGHVHFFESEREFREAAQSKVNPDKLQSHPSTNKEGKELIMFPGYDAFNYRCDLEAALTVFEFFKDVSPITTLGKFAAYRVKINVGNLKKWSELMRQFCEGCDLFQMSKKQLMDLRRFNVTAFGKAHPTAPLFRGKGKPKPTLQKARSNSKFALEFEEFDAKAPAVSYESHQSSGGDDNIGIPPLVNDEILSDWFDDRDKSYGMAPAYDPLLAFVMVKDLSTGSSSEMVAGITRGVHRLVPGDRIKDSSFGKLKKSPTLNLSHSFIGNSSKRNSVINNRSSHDMLVESISKGMVRPTKDN